MSGEVAAKTNARTVVQQGIVNLETVYKSLVAKISEYSEKVNKIKSFGVKPEYKDNALAGIKKITEDYTALKEARLTETRKMDAFVKMFTDAEKQLDSIRNDLQLYANDCLKEEIRLNELKRAEETKEKNKELEMISFRGACRDYIQSQYAAIQKEYAAKLREIMDSFSPDQSEADFVQQLRSIEINKIKNAIPEFCFVHNSQPTDKELKDHYIGVYTELDSEYTEAKKNMDIYLQDCIKMIPSLIKQLKTDAGKAKESLEAKAVLAQAQIDVNLEEKLDDNKLSDTLTMVSAEIPEVVVKSKKVITAKIVSHAGGLSLCKWYFQQDEYTGKSVEKLESLSLGNMLTLAKKQYASNPDFDLNGIEFTEDVAAK